VAALEHPARRRLGLDAAGSTAVLNPTHPHHYLAHAEQVAGQRAQVFERLAEVAQVPADPVMAVIFPSLQREK
jgi:hypothetical protein